ncbi:single-stranded DNA-binding protein [Agromyces marinus]|uniref:Single-stranded DNA-binding protein n=1 Tax=Agromyces marinus TaxID=1389020 RepID=A0ABM8H638_9MICO|nr:single-stranded DNA-binding protein [Agromyces marinus]UIP58824.1 Single-stranded DNA-binding protein [Agromyces marinus]BDZ56233.1 hypothetical protein GCM10025870_33060 [Agromyces marinus]
MTDHVTVVGVVGSDPRHTVTSTGLSITNFRLASTRRYFDRERGAWADGETNWFTVATFRQLALNASQSLRKGHRVIVHGRLKVRSWDTGERSGTAIEIDADSIGHDLAWGVSAYAKTTGRPAEPASASTTAAAGADGDAHSNGAGIDAGGSSWITGDASESSTAWSGTDAADLDPFDGDASGDGDEPDRDDPADADTELDDVARRGSVLEEGMTLRVDA